MPFGIDVKFNEKQIQRQLKALGKEVDAAMDDALREVAAEGIKHVTEPRRFPTRTGTAAANIQLINKVTTKKSRTIKGRGATALANVRAKLLKKAIRIKPRMIKGRDMKILLISFVKPFYTTMIRKKGTKERVTPLLATSIEKAVGNDKQKLFKGFKRRGL